MLEKSSSSTWWVTSGFQTRPNIQYVSSIQHVSCLSRDICSDGHVQNNSMEVPTDPKCFTAVQYHTLSHSIEEFTN